MTTPVVITEREKRDMYSLVHLERGAQFKSKFMLTAPHLLPLAQFESI